MLSQADGTGKKNISLNNNWFESHRDLEAIFWWKISRKRKHIHCRVESLFSSGRPENMAAQGLPCIASVTKPRWMTAYPASWRGCLKPFSFFCETGQKALTACSAFVQICSAHAFILQSMNLFLTFAKRTEIVTEVSSIFGKSASGILFPVRFFSSVQFIGCESLNKKL